MNSYEVREFLPSFLKEGCVVPTQDSTFWIGWGESWRSVSPEAGHLSVYSPDFFLKEPKPWRVFSQFQRISLSELANALKARASSPSSKASDFSWRAPDRKLFEKTFADLRARFDTGSIKKAVPIVFATSQGKLGPTDINRLLSRALEMASQFPLAIYGFWNAEEGMLGATPELLFRRKSELEISTVALAGTRPHSSSLAERRALLEDPKELEEHRFVLDGIASSLGSWGQVRMGSTRELRLQKFSHLLTPVEVALSAPRSFEEIARALHPTPALGAWPREAGLRWLESLQEHGDRRRFGAPFGALGPDVEEGEGVCWVAIRGVQWQEQNLQLGAGCGITAQSELEREWQELGLKLESSRVALGL